VHALTLTLYTGCYCRKTEKVCASERSGYDNGVLETIAEELAGLCGRLSRALSYIEIKINYIPKEAFQKFAAPFDDGQ
jgi:hypothetical protein